MRHELRRIEPLRAANVLALVYGLLTAVLAIIFSPIMMLAFLLAPRGDSGAGAPIAAGFLMVLYPVVGLVMGWITGLLGAAIYNLVVRWTGGLLVELAGPPDPAGAGTAAT